MNLSTVKRGDTWKFIFYWKDGATPTPNPINLSGCSARMQIRKQRLGTLVASASTDDGNILIDGVLGKVTVTFPADATMDCPIGNHDTDLEITFTDGEVRSSQTLVLNVKEDITR